MDIYFGGAKVEKLRREWMKRNINISLRKKRID